MIGSALKKYAKEHGMTVAKGYAFGKFKGYDCAFSEGGGYKLIVVSTVFPDDILLQQLTAAMSARDLRKEYRVQELHLLKDGIIINFFDNPGTMKKIRAFCDWFFPQLAQYEAGAAGICPECGLPISGEGKWLVMNGLARHMHTGCAAAMQQKVRHEEQKASEEDTGSYGSGFAGAFVGSFLGAIVWALIYLLGRVAAVVGFLIAFLADKGYNKLHGKQGKGKVLILLVCSVLGVILGTFLGEWFSCVQLILQGRIGGIGIFEMIPILFEMILFEAESRSVFIANTGLGLVYALLGMFVVLHRANKSVSGAKFIELN